VTKSTASLALIKLLTLNFGYVLYQPIPRLRIGHWRAVRWVSGRHGEASQLTAWTDFYRQDGDCRRRYSLFRQTTVSWIFFAVRFTSCVLGVANRQEEYAAVAQAALLEAKHRNLSAIQEKRVAISLGFNRGGNDAICWQAGVIKKGGWGF